MLKLTQARSRTNKRKAHKPKAGPSAKPVSNQPKGNQSVSATNSKMLKVLMAKPMLLVSVSTLPTACGGALRAVSVENCGESPATLMPQTNNQR